jgi:hypothetical protein
MSSGCRPAPLHPRGGYRRPGEHTGPELRSCGKILTARVAVHLPCDKRLLEAEAEGVDAAGNAGVDRDLGQHLAESSP